MKAIPLTEFGHGIDRQRPKGAAKGLYQLRNAYITNEKTARLRPGLSGKVTLPAGTFGLFGFGDLMQVFATATAVAPAGYELNIIRHPTLTQALAKIHFVSPIFGKLYVVAEFANGDVFHYWLLDPNAWAATTAYLYGGIVRPSVDNGYVYKVTNADTTAAWTANTDIAVNDERQPTSFNNFKYKAVSVTGTPVKTSDTEPVWPTVAGEQVVERRYNTTNTATTPGNPDAPPPREPPYIPPGGQIP